eukprot:g3741.t1
MKQILLVLVYCFVLASSYSISADLTASRKLKETKTRCSTTTVSSVSTSDITTESYSSTSSQSETNSTATASPEDDVQTVVPPSQGASPPPVVCVNALPRDISAMSANGRLNVVRTTSLDVCCENCRRGTYGTCRSWWREDGNGRQNCYLNANQ